LYAHTWRIESIHERSDESRTRYRNALVQNAQGFGTVLPGQKWLSLDMKRLGEGGIECSYCIKATAPSIQKELDKVPFHARILKHII
jgi:hypothetical protein